MSLYPCDFRPSFLCVVKPKAANSNTLPPVSPWTIRLWQGVVEASKVIRKRALKLERQGLRLVEGK